MAKQRGILPINGKLGNLVYFSLNGKNFVKSAPKAYIQPEACQKSGKDFGTASSATALIKKGLQPLMGQLGDSNSRHRLRRLLIKQVNTGPVALQGKRQVTDGDVALLKGFEFNQYTSVNTLVRCKPSITIDPATAITIALPAMRTKDMFYPPAKATAAVLQFTSCVLYFSRKNGHFLMPDDLVIPLTTFSFVGGKFSLPLESVGEYVLLAAWGIQFITGNEDGISRNRKYYASNILQAVHIRDGKIITFQYPEPVITTKPTNTGTRVAWEMNEE